MSFQHCSIPIYHKHFWIVILIAVFNIMSILTITYSGHKDRTSEHNQVVLFACQIPFTALIRWAILRQGLLHYITYRKLLVHCKKRHLVPKRYFYLHKKRCKISIYGVKHNFLLNQIVVDSLNNIT